MKTPIPYVAEQLLLNSAGEILALRGGSFPLTDAQQHIVERILEGGWSVQDLGQTFGKAWTMDSDHVQYLIMNFLAHLPFVGIAELDIPAAVDAVIIDRGWGGVSRHALDLWQHLNQRHRVLLISGSEPSYGFDEKLSTLLITPKSCVKNGISFMGFISIVRTFVKKLHCRLLLFTHYAMTPYFFDVVARQPTITFGDAYGEATLSVGRHLAPDPPVAGLPLFWQELFYGREEPWFNLAVAKAYYWSFRQAAENWFWTGSQLAEAERLFPELSHKYRLVLPLIDTDTFAPSECDSGECCILFTTTSPAVGSKGLDPLRRIFERLPGNARLRLVLDDVAFAPETLGKWGPRVEILAKVPKAEMPSIYRSSLANCRISQDDSAPLSVLESMACGVPVIVSPLVARNVPVIMDGITGFVVEPDDLDTLEKRLLFLIANPEIRRRVGAAGRRVVLHYSLSNNLALITQYFDNGSSHSEVEQFAVYRPPKRAQSEAEACGAQSDAL